MQQGLVITRKRHCGRHQGRWTAGEVDGGVLGFNRVCLGKQCVTLQSRQTCHQEAQVGRKAGVLAAGTISEHWGGEWRQEGQSLEPLSPFTIVLYMHALHSLRPPLHCSPKAKELSVARAPLNASTGRAAKVSHFPGSNLCVFLFYKGHRVRKMGTNCQMTAAFLLQPLECVACFLITTLAASA